MTDSDDAITDNLGSVLSRRITLADIARLFDISLSLLASDGELLRELQKPPP